MNPNKISLRSFIQRLKSEFIFLNKFIRLYFCHKFLNENSYKLELPILQEESRILNSIHWTFFTFSNDSFHYLNQIPLLYSPKKAGTSFNRLVYSILGYEGPTLIIIKHIEKNDRENNNKDTTYIFGAISKSTWREELAYIGDYNNYLMKIFPKFHNFFSYKGAGGKSFAYLNTKQIDRSKYKVGLGIEKFFRK